MDFKIEEVVDYIKKHCPNVTITIDNNPTPEKIKQVKALIQRRKELEEMFRKRYLER